MKSLLFLCIVLSGLSIGCSHGRRTYVPTDLGAGAEAGADTDLGVGVDSGVPADAGVPTDTGSPTDMGSSRDLGTVPRDMGFVLSAEQVDCAEVAAGPTVSASVGSGFVPSRLDIGRGQTVRWNNSDSFTHTVTANGGAFNATLAASSSICIRFNETAEYPYLCEIHTSMTGTIAVH